MTVMVNDIDKAVEILNKAFNVNKTIKSAKGQIYADLAACGYDNSFKIAEGINNAINRCNLAEHLKDCDQLFKKPVLYVIALYFMLISYNKEYAKKYRVEPLDDDDIALFVNTICK